LNDKIDSMAALDSSEKILVIKLGALGDFIQAMGPAASIRAHHPSAEITLLTTAPFLELARAAPYFDRVRIDERPPLWDLAALLRLRSWLRGENFARVYDLQTAQRTSWYFRLMGPGQRPRWSGIARGASHPHANPARDLMHTLDRQAEQLRIAGIAQVAAPDLSWASRDIARFALPERFVLLVPGGAAHRPEKRWPIAHYAALAQRLAARGLVPVVLGGKDEAPLGAAIVAACPEAKDLTGQTSLGEIVGLGAAAFHAIGNDTGPMHAIVAAGARALVLYSAASDPALTQPRGAGVVILRRPALADLTVDEVEAALGLG
jgi:ADP-heptose:LPS heptosyltransferase